VVLSPLSHLFSSISLLSSLRAQLERGSRRARPQPVGERSWGRALAGNAATRHRCLFGAGRRALPPGLGEGGGFPTVL